MALKDRWHHNPIPPQDWPGLNVSLRRLDQVLNAPLFFQQFLPVFNVKVYGAVGNGTTDDTAAIVAAETARAAVNGTLLFPHGTYLLATYSANTDAGSSALKINAAGRWLGEGVVWLKFSQAAGTGEMLRVNSNPAAGVVADVHIDNIGFDGNAFQCAQGIGIRLMGTRDCIVSRCRFTGFGYLSATQFSYSIRNEGYGTPANPFVWTNALPSNFSHGTRIIDCRFTDAKTGGGSGSPNAIFNYQVDGAMIRGNVIRGYGIGVMTYGPNRRVSVIQNELEDGEDNGIRFEQDVTGDIQRNREHTVIGNVIRKMTVDGIRLNGYRITCKGNVSVYNGNTGIKADACQASLIEGNVVTNNGNKGIMMAQATLSAQGGHADIQILGNYASQNLGPGIFVVGGGDTGAIPATHIQVSHNTCIANGGSNEAGIQMWDADAKSSITNNLCAENGPAGGTGAGIGVRANLLSWGGLTIRNNRCYGLVTGNAATAKQCFGIWFTALPGLTLSKCYSYYNDCSDTPDTTPEFGAPIATNRQIGGGTVNAQYLHGTLYRNSTRTVTQASLGVNLGATDIVVQEDETGDAVRPGALAVLGALSVSASATIQGALSVSAATTLGGTLTVSAATHLQSTLSIVGPVGIGVAPVGNAGLNLTYEVQDTGSQFGYGIVADPVAALSVTNHLRAIGTRVRTLSANYTLSAGFGLYLLDASKGTSSTITSLYGMLIEDQTAGTTNWAIKTGLGRVDLGDTLSVAGAAVFSSTLTIKGALSASSTATFGGQALFTTNIGTRYNNHTNGAALAVGTLTNAPVAGDPAFWLPVSIAGTTRYIPCW